METTNPNITPEGNFRLTYFPYAMNAEPCTPLEEAIQFLYDCYNYEEEYPQHSPMVKEQLQYGINKVLLPACAEGNQDAIYWMFFAYMYGIGVEEDCSKALDYLTIIAEYGYPDMQYELGTLYDDCDALKMGWRSRKLEAARWFKRAADQSYVEAMFVLGTIYDSCGWGVRHYRKRAFVWFKRAAELGHDEAMRSLSVCYKFGCGTKKNREKALVWAEKAGWHQEAERLRNGECDFELDEDGFLPYSMLDLGDDESPF